jgi:hypothetical protein
VSTVSQATALYRRKPDSVESADLRHGNGYALRLRGVTTVSAEAVKEAPSRRRPNARTERTGQGTGGHMAKEYKDLIVGLDIGTAKVMVVVGEVCPAASSSWRAWAWPPAMAQARRGGQHRRHGATASSRR